MVLTKNQLFSEFANTSGAFDTLVDHFCPLIGQNDYNNPKDNELRIQLIKAISFILFNYTIELSRFQDSLKVFLQILLFVIEGGDISSKIESFRSFTLLYTNYGQVLKLRLQRLLLFRLVAYSPISSPLHFMSMDYVLKNYPTTFKFIPLCSVLIKRDLAEGDNLLSLEMYLKLAKKEDPFDVYNFLFGAIITHPYLGRSAVDVIVNTLSSFNENANAIHYLLFLFRKILIFMGLAKSMNRYQYRVYLIENLYKKLISLELGQITTQVRRIMKSLLKNNYCMDFNNETYTAIEPDPLSDSFLSSSIIVYPHSLKQFAVYPYDTEIDSLLLEEDVLDYSSDSYLIE